MEYFQYANNKNLILNIYGKDAWEILDFNIIIFSNKVDLQIRDLHEFNFQYNHLLDK